MKIFVWLLAGLCLSAFAIAAPNSSEPVPGAGRFLNPPDVEHQSRKAREAWIIGGDDNPDQSVTIDTETTIDQDIVIKNNGSLTIENTTLRLNGTIESQDNATLTVSIQGNTYFAFRSRTTSANRFVPSARSGYFPARLLLRRDNGACNNRNTEMASPATERPFCGCGSQASQFPSVSFDGPQRITSPKLIVPLVGS